LENFVLKAIEAPIAAGAGLAALAHPVLHVWTGTAAKLADFKSVSNSALS
jgi:hypothetical protein